LAAEVPVLRVTVFPDAVTSGAFGFAGAGAGFGRVAVRVGSLGVVRAGAGAGAGSAAGVAGTSFSWGCTVVSRPAICKSRLRAVSRASEVSLLLSETVHALSDSAAAKANGAPASLIYFVIQKPP
jgi:hypothetical protein